MDLSEYETDTSLLSSISYSMVLETDEKALLTRVLTLVSSFCKEQSCVGRIILNLSDILADDVAVILSIHNRLLCRLPYFLEFGSFLTTRTQLQSLQSILKSMVRRFWSMVIVWSLCSRGVESHLQMSSVTLLVSFRWFDYRHTSLCIHKTSPYSSMASSDLCTPCIYPNCASLHSDVLDILA